MVLCQNHSAIIKLNDDYKDKIMNGENENRGDKLSMGLSVFIALCVVSLFCAISIAIVENLDTLSHTDSSRRVNLQNNREFADFIL